MGTYANMRMTRTYLIIPAYNSCHSRSAELDHIDTWARRNNLRLNRAKCAEIVFTERRRRRPVKLPPCLPDLVRVFSRPYRIMGGSRNSALGGQDRVRVRAVLVSLNFLYPSIRVRTAPTVSVRVKNRVSVSFSFSGKLTLLTVGLLNLRTIDTEPSRQLCHELLRSVDACVTDITKPRYGY